MTMISRAHLPAFLAAAVLVWSALLILNGQSVSLQLLKPFSTVAGVVGVLALAFDKWLWRWAPLHPWFVATPDLQGTWRGELVSDWRREGGEPIAPVEAFLVVRQTFSTISMRLLTSESTSVLLSGSVSKAPDGVDTASGVYLNTPDALRREASPIHHGGLILQIQGIPPAALQGEYWTDRKTKGQLRFIARSPRLFYAFDEATKATYGSRQP
jgi:hypothetical protein